jgi:SPP1 gp7 family putative phage head morphogenesis protein
MLNVAFNKPPIDNIAYLLQKKPELHFNYGEIMFEAHHKAFTVAKITKADLLQDMQVSLLKAQKEGKSFESWKKEIKPTLQKKGWWGTKKAMNPKTGEFKEIKIGSSRLRTIYQTNMSVAYAQSRAKGQYEGKTEYLRYSAIMDGKTRPKHKLMHGKILHRDNDFWTRNYPPNGFNCRCLVSAYRKSQIEKKGWVIEEEAPEDIADKGWAYDKRNLVVDDDELENLIKQKAQKIADTNDPDKIIRSYLKEDLQELKEERKRWTDFKAFFANPKGSFILSSLSLKLKEIMGAKTDKILLSAETLKSHTHHSEIGAFDYYLIKHMQKNVLFSVQENDTRIILLKKLGVVYKAVIKVTEDKKEVYLISLHKVTDANKEIKKISKKGKEIKI